MVGNIYQMKCS